MIALATTAIGWIIFVASVSAGCLLLGQPRGQARARLRDRAGAEPQPVLRRRDVGGPRLIRVQVIGVLLLITMVIGLPLYWVLEPGRQAGAVSAKEETFVGWGSDLFETTANGGFNCAGLPRRHEGRRWSGADRGHRSEDRRSARCQLVRTGAQHGAVPIHRRRGEFILDYGRTFSPMSAWGTIGGGPMNAQQIHTIIAYLRPSNSRRRVASRNRPSSRCPDSPT